MNKCKKVIMISGKAGSGKDTVANIIRNMGDYDVFAFADNLKDYVGMKYGISERLLFTQEGKRQIINVDDEQISVRNLLIREAEMKRNEDESFWSRLVIYKAIETDSGVIISDFRFPAEYYEMKKYFEDVVTIRVNRPFEMTEMVDSHTEDQLENFQFDYILDNNSNIDYLKHQVEIIFKYFLF